MKNLISILSFLFWSLSYGQNNKDLNKEYWTLLSEEKFETIYENQNKILDEINSENSNEKTAILICLQDVNHQMLAFKKALNLEESIYNEINHFLGMDRQQVVQDPMLRSGLLLTGANKTLKGESKEVENGLLSASKASLLDLRETELIILSACKIGKGEVKNSKGVYGLRKAFSYAGAQYIIMSLWKVDDKVIQEFMSRFYEIWLNEKTTIRKAFKETQLEIKANYP